MFSFSNLKVIQKSLFIIFSERKNYTINFKYDKKRNSCEKTERRKRKTNKQTKPGFISCRIIHTDKLLTVLSLPEAVLSI